MRSMLLAASVLLSALMSSACTVIGPSVMVAPGPGKSEAAFETDHRNCMALTDATLQPVADRLNAQASSLQQSAANNGYIQAEYNRSFASCMASRGNMPAPSAFASAQPPAVMAPGPSREPISTPAADGHGAGFHLLRLSYHRAGSASADPNDVLWRDAIAKAVSGPGGLVPIYSIMFDDGPRSVLISIAGQGPEICDNGSNDVASTRDYGICPGKLAILAGSRILAVRDLGPICFEAIDNAGILPGGPGWKEPTAWGTRGLYDQPGRSVHLITMQDGRIERACNKTVRVR